MKGRVIFTVSVVGLITCLSASNAQAQQAEFWASDGVAGNHFGQSIAATMDYIVVGDPADDEEGRNSGAIYIFEPTSPHPTLSWTESQKVTCPIQDERDSCGSSVDIYNDTIIVGCPRATPGGNNSSGMALIIRRDTGGDWLCEEVLEASDQGPYDSFGYSVAITRDAALVGAPAWDTPTENNIGAAYIFHYSYSAASLIEHERWNDGGAAGANFGFSVDIFHENAIVGAPNGGRGQQGAAHLYNFRFDPGTGQDEWFYDDSVSGSLSSTGNRFGHSVGIGLNYAIVGEPNYDHVTPSLNKLEQGLAYIFAYDPSWVGYDWFEVEQLWPEEPESWLRFGTSVAIGNDFAIVGAPYDDHSGFSDVGSAYVFERVTCTNWGTKDHFTLPNGEYQDLFGVSVTLVEDSPVLYGHVGAPSDTPSYDPTLTSAGTFFANYW